MTPFVSRVGRGGVMAMVALGLVGCTADEAPTALPDRGRVPAGAVRGEVVAYIADLPNGTSEHLYFLRGLGKDDSEQRLIFKQTPDLNPGTIVDVWANPAADGLGVIRFETVAAAEATGPVEASRRALLNGTPVKPRKIAFIIVDVGGGTNITEAQATLRLFGTGDKDASLRQYYIEASYGKQDIGGQVFGPLKYTMTACDTSAMANALRPMLPTGFDHYLWYFGSRVSACAWSGLASVGSPTRPSRDTWYNASSSCVVLVQEPGHNFGMSHSSSMSCKGTSFNDVPDGNCTHNEYGDPYDPMGKGCRHMNSYQKAYQGWYGLCNAVDVKSTGTFTILPTELACDGIQSLQIPMAKPRPFMRSGGGGAAGTVNLTHYFVELRAPYGFDTGMAPVVQIRTSGDIRMRNQVGFNTWFLDMNPATTALDGLGVGGSYTDPDGTIKITVDALSATSATVRVEMQGGVGAPTCMDGTPMVAPGPGPETCSAAPIRAGATPPVFGDGGVAASDARVGGGPPAGSSRDGGAAAGAGDAGLRLPPDTRPADTAPPVVIDSPPDAAPPVEMMRPVLPPDAAAAAMPVADPDITTPVNRKVSGGCSCRVGGADRPSGRDDRGQALAGLLLMAGVILQRKVRRR